MTINPISWGGIDCKDCQGISKIIRNGGLWVTAICRSARMLESTTRLSSISRFSVLLLFIELYTYLSDCRLSATQNTKYNIHTEPPQLLSEEIPWGWSCYFLQTEAVEKVAKGNGPAANTRHRTLFWFLILIPYFDTGSRRLQVSSPAEFMWQYRSF